MRRGEQPVPVARFKQIVEYVRIGSQIETAVAAAGISAQTFRNWLRRGADAREKVAHEEALTNKDKAYLKFVEDMDVAVAESELIDLMRIDKAADLQWQAAAWKLERRFPHRYALHQRISQENFNIDLSNLSDEQLLRLLNGEPLSAVLS